MAKILLVEDNEMNRDMLSRRLARKGHEVVVGEDGQKAVDWSSRRSPQPRAAGVSPQVAPEASRQAALGGLGTGAR